jgi:hypothetical protein
MRSFSAHGIVVAASLCEAQRLGVCNTRATRLTETRLQKRWDVLIVCAPFRQELPIESQ